jgi:tight adherence protein B
VTTFLLVTSAALVAWPAPHRSSARLATRSPRSGASLLRRLVTSPWSGAAGAGAVAAVLSTPLVAVLAAGCAALGIRALGIRQDRAGADARLLALAEALGVLAAELRAGRALPDAASAAAGACPVADLRRDLTSVLRAAATADAVAPAVPELAAVSSAVQLSLRTGCSLAGVAAALEDDLRARHRHRLELRAATAGPRASAVVLAGLPLLGLAMGSGIGADPWRVLTTTGPGQVLLVAGVLLEIAGVAWTGRLTRRAAPELAAGGPGG